MSVINPRSLGLHGLLALTLLGLPALCVAQAEEGSQARVQIINNVSNLSSYGLDVYIGSWYAAADLDFRTASPFMAAPAGPVKIRIYRASSNAPAENVAAEVLLETDVMLAEGMTYQLIAVAEPNADEAIMPIQLVITEMNQEESAPDSTTAQLHILNGSPDVSALDYSIFGADFTTLSAAGRLSYSEAAVHSVKAQDGAIRLLAEAATSEEEIGRFEAPLADYAGQVVTILTSGRFVRQDRQAPSFSLLAIAEDGSTRVLGNLQPSSETTVREALRLHGAYPNPFNPTTNVSFDLPADAVVTVAVYDMTGRRVMETAPQRFVAGSAHQVRVDASILSSGAYVYQVRAQTAQSLDVETGRMLLLK